jgi:nitric oxide dioxygenase
MPLNVSVLEQSFNLVEPKAKEFADSFYDTLFTDCPESRPLFANTDMEKQKQKLIMSLVYVVTNLRYPEILKQTLKDLGAKHVTHGAVREQYPIVGDALLKTLKSYLGTSWTGEVEQAWNDAYQEIAALMIEGAQEYEATLTPPEPPAENNNPSQQSIPKDDFLPELKGLKTFLIACGVMGGLLFGFWLYTIQNESPSNASPPNNETPSNLQK